MSDIVASSIIDEASIIIYDRTNVRWPVLDMLQYLNSAQYQIVNVKPEVGTKTVSVVSAQGTRHSLPADGMMFYRVNRNMGSDGNTPGKAVRVVSMNDMDTENIDWHTDAASNDVTHYIFRESDPRTYFLWPQPATGRWHELVYSAAPTPLTAITDKISIDDIYRNPLVDWMLYMAYRKNNAIDGNSRRASDSYSAFYRNLGMKDAAENRYDPNVMAEKARKVKII